MGISRVRITDQSNKSFEVVIDISYFGKFTEGTFQVQNRGFVAFNEGVCRKCPIYGLDSHYTALHLYGGSEGWGIRLESWDSLTGVSDGGTGLIHLNWARAIEPGKISWSLIS